MDLQLNLNETTEKQLQQEAAERNISVSQFISELLKNYFKYKTTDKKSKKAMTLLNKFAVESPQLPILEEEMMDFINAEIKTYREEKRQAIERQMRD
jgi:hypothetical protein